MIVHLESNSSEKRTTFNNPKLLTSLLRGGCAEVLYIKIDGKHIVLLGRTAVHAVAGANQRRAEIHSYDWPPLISQCTFVVGE